MAFAVVRILTSILFLIILFSSPYMCLCRCPPQEYEALLSFNLTFHTISGDDIPFANTGRECCELDGINCDKHNRHVVEIIIDYFFDGRIILDNLCKFPFLRKIDISDVGIPTGTLPSCLKNLHYLRELNIEENGLGGLIPLTICMLTNLTSLSLSGNQLSGSLPFCLCNLSLLSTLDLSGNQLSGSLPFCLNNLSSLRDLDLRGNQLSGQIPFTWGDLSLLEILDVSFNQLSGTLPLSFSRLSSLTYLSAEGNRFNESTSSWALPSSIKILYLSLNHEFTISESFFSNLTKLDTLSLSNCTLNISTSWIPHFQLAELKLVSCLMDGEISPWISTQFSLKTLTLANNGLAGEIPSWLWAMSSLQKLNLSQNLLHGPLLPNGANFYTLLDVSSNSLSGCIPSDWGMTYGWTMNDGDDLPSLILMLNDNLFTGNIPPSLCNLSRIVSNINLANNKLGGMIPLCLIEDGPLIYDLNLGANSLEGTIPQGLIISSTITSLVIRNNQLSGAFLPSFQSQTGLQVLDIGHNKFTGHLPKSIGNISSLQVLVMNNNQFSGNILPQIGELKQLQILDLSSNNLSGSIPHNIVFLQAMAIAKEDGHVLQQSEVGTAYDDYEGTNTSLGGLNMTSKGTELYYPYILSTLTRIDLSNNQLNGNIPLDFGKLKGLRFLNLSRNNLNGIVPPSLGDMSQLEALDLSSNKLSGSIPSEFQSLAYLAYLNMSNNNLSGNIPQGGQMITFENTSYSGNPSLQGCPLPKNCNWPKFAPPPPVSIAQKQSEQIPWYQIGVGWSYGAGFLIVAVLLLSVKERWRMEYFKRVDNILKSLFPFLRNRRL